MMNSGLPTHRRYEGERRAFPRYQVKTPAHLVAGDATIEGEIDDLSATGASFSTRQIDPELEEGTQVVLRGVLETPDGDRQLERRCRILRGEDFFDGGDDVMTYAVTFDEPLADDCFDDQG